MVLMRHADWSVMWFWIKESFCRVQIKLIMAGPPLRPGTDMDPILNISDDCIGCGQCVNVCIRGHLQVLEDKRVHEVDSGYTCFRCGHCSSVCPTNAIHLIGSEYGERIDECPVPPESLESLLRQRRSRRWFDRKCTKEEIDRLMSAIRYAPTAENSQKV